MRKPKITLAFDKHRNREVVNLQFEKDFQKIGLGHEGLKTTQRYILVAEHNFKNFKNPLDELL